jgi:hypothetical protein
VKGIEKLKSDPMARRLLDGLPTASVPLVPGGTPVTVRTGERVRFTYRGRDYVADVLRIETWGWRCRPTDSPRWMSCSWDGIGAEA